MFKRAQEIASYIHKAKHIHIVTHIDADGIAAGAIAVKALERLGKDYTIESVKQLDDRTCTKLIDENHELVWFTDLGSSITLHHPQLKKIITDHHVCSKETNVDFHLNPHLFDINGTFEISGAGVTYYVAKALQKKNIDLSALAIVGACGDLQDRRFGALQGLNREICKDGEQSKSLQIIKDICYFGRETRPLVKLLQYANDPIIPGVSGREDTCLSFLQELHIRLKKGDTWRKWIDLSKDERQTIISGIVQQLLSKGFGTDIAKRVIGETYLLLQEQIGTELHDAREFATLLNSTARYGQYEVGLQVCLGDRGEWLEKARNLLKGHRQNLMEGLQVARDEEIQKRTYVQFFHGGEGIRDTIVGIVTNMLLNTESVDRNLPLIGFAITERGDVKASARATQALIDKGLNLSVVMKHAARKINGVGGGHNIAAGATIPKGKEEEFLELVEQEIKQQIEN